MLTGVSRLRDKSVILMGGRRNSGSDVFASATVYRQYPRSVVSRAVTVPRTHVVTGVSSTTVPSRAVSHAASAMPAVTKAAIRMPVRQKPGRCRSAKNAMPKTHISSASLRGPGVCGSQNHTSTPEPTKTGTNRKACPKASSSATARLNCTCRSRGRMPPLAAIRWARDPYHARFSGCCGTTSARCELRVRAWVSMLSNGARGARSCSCPCAMDAAPAAAISPHCATGKNEMQP